MVQTRSNANVGTGAPQQGENSTTGGRNPPITTGEVEALIQRVGITAEQFQEVLAALAPNREVVVEDVAGGPTGGKAGPTGSQGKKKKVRRSQKKKATKPNGKAVMADALSRLEEEDDSSSFERIASEGGGGRTATSILCGTGVTRGGAEINKHGENHLCGGMYGKKAYAIFSSPSGPRVIPDPIGTLLRSPNAPSRVSKWGVFLGSFQIEFKPQPAIKGQALADFVVECTARKVGPSGEEPEGSWWTVYTDGSSATDASGGGVVAISPEGFKAYYSVRFRFKVSNNEAEYEALLCGLRLAASLRAERIQVRCDSKLVVGHVTREFEAKDERMKKYRDTALELLKAFGAYRIEQVPREENAEADILSKLGPDSPDHIKAMTQEEELLEPSISPGEVLIIALKEEPDWIDQITMYILDESLPADPIAAKVVKRRAPGYTLECGRLYKRSYNGTLLRCLRAGEAQKLMEEIHEGICSAHQGAFTMSRKVTLQGYFWPTIIRDCAEYVRKCKVCQEFQRVPGRPATNYTPISTAIPFARWGIDLVGILPRGTGNNTYLVVAIDYFTKWVEAAPVPTITAEQMTKFVSKQILCRFGVPQQIITDNGTQFEAGGTTPRKATGETPFSLTYGFEARAPAETSLLSYRVETFDAQENEENLRAELHLVDERRERAYMRAENYRRQVKSYHDQRVRPRKFQVGDWVLRKREVSRPTDGGKFAKCFEGPYIIKEVLADGTFRLQTPAGGDVPRVWNAANLVKFYQ
ncbi:unnamed protein product [Cuscuta campestris]|uniref:Uncharacterized protein n=1 Tax=Cuscuta campestris TaxID=132261 RepID=A0A484KDN4_9ASTE|nr:unnamed protein product [Cuscuta campestris]